MKAVVREMWNNGALMPEQAAAYICGRIRLWLAVKVMPLAALTVIILVVSFDEPAAKIPLAVLCGLWAVLILWRDLMRLGRLKRRDFYWCAGVTAGFVGRRMKGDVKVGTETVRGCGHPANMFYLRNGIPVYVVTLNTRESSFFKGGFITDPLVFKNKY